MLRFGSFVPIAVCLLICSLCFAGGTVIGWGDPSNGKLNLPALPSGVTYTAVAASQNMSVALRSDGTIETVGTAGGQSITPPALPAGGAYVAISAGLNFALAIRRDGQAVGWGNSFQGEASPPALPAGLTYVAVACGQSHSLALRSDGSVIGFGRSTEGQIAVPALPAGLKYIAIAAGDFHSLALRSDGQVIAWGFNNNQQINVPALPAGVTYTAIAASSGHSLALRSDGTLKGWGQTFFNESDAPALPENVKYIGVAKAYLQSIALRSDGQIVSWGKGDNGLNSPPALNAGTSFSLVSAGPMALHALAIVVPGLPLGSAFTYQGILRKDGVPGSTTADLRFSLFRSASGLTQVGASVTKTALPVSQGVFSTELDFGPGAFDGTARWIEIEARTPTGVGSFVTLSPRERVSPTPMALIAPGFKSFIIDHPDDPDKYLVHVALEGPEVAVFYRGTAQLTHGRAVISLPAYFDSLTRADRRTIQLTNVGGFDRIAVAESAGGEFDHNSFTVLSDNPASSQKFHWEVKAVRADGDRLVVEPFKSEVQIRGDGPYTYSVPQPARSATPQPADH